MPVTRIIILVENTASARGLLGEHGFAAWVEAGGRRILFDTGQGRALAPNADRLGCALAEVDAVVLSHGHYDHTGGVEEVLSRARGAEVYLHQGAFQPRYVKDRDSARAIRVPGNSLKALDRFEDARVHWATRPLELTEAVGVTGPIPRTHEIEDVGGAFFLDQACTRPDLIEDDLALWLRSPAGLVVCVGCSHAGIINTLEAVMSITGQNDIHTVIGGMHLVNASEERLRFTAEALNRIGVSQVVPCHCTGDGAASFLEEHLDGQVTRGRVGLILQF